MTPALPPAAIGTVDARGLRPALFRWMLRDKHRFPGSGGFAVQLNTPITISVAPSGTAVGKTVWGPNPLGAGAIVDIPVDLSTV